jgi:hypothetical protein
MVKPLPHLGADSSLMKQECPTIIKTPCGMILDLSHLPYFSQELLLSSLTEQESPTSIIKTPGGMSLNASRPPTARAAREARLRESYFQSLLQFRDREGHLRVPARHVEDGTRLGAWTSRTRTQKSRGTLNPELERRLNEIGFSWREKIGTWDFMCSALKQFKQREGHCATSQRHIEHLDGGVEIKLGDWVAAQRRRQRRGTLDAKKEKQLQSIGVKWNNIHQDISDEFFDRNYGLLLAYQEREGHVRVPIKHQESANDNLGSWLSNLRSLYRNGKIDLDRQKWLEIAGVTWERWIGAD